MINRSHGIQHNLGRIPPLWLADWERPCWREGWPRTCWGQGRVNAKAQGERGYLGKKKSVFSSTHRVLLYSQYFTAGHQMFGFSTPSNCRLHRLRAQFHKIVPHFRCQIQVVCPQIPTTSVWLGYKLEVPMTPSFGLITC